jgi:hypothetical protein
MTKKEFLKIIENAQDNAIIKIALSSEAYFAIETVVIETSLAKSTTTIKLK